MPSTVASVSVAIGGVSIGVTAIPAGPIVVYLDTLRAMSTSVRKAHGRNRSF